MTDMMILDLSSDDGLLVPFRGLTEPPVKEKDESSINTPSTSTNKENSKHNISTRGFGRFLFNRRIPPEPKEEENLPLKVTTFAFPSARAEVAESFPEPQTEGEAQDDGGGGGDDDDGTGHMSYEERPRAKSATPVTPNTPTSQAAKRSMRNLDEWEPYENPWYEEKSESRSWRLEGIGSNPVPPHPENEPRGLAGLWHNLIGQGHRRREQDDLRDLRSMKVATEDTKDDKTILEQIGKAALVVIAPEIYADDEDGDGNLGLYRSINMTPEDDDNDPRNEDTALRSELQQLRLKLLRLEKALKTSELEASSWKIRCKEVETQLRRYKGQSDEDSSVEADAVSGMEKDDDDQEEEEEDDDSDNNQGLDDGIEEQWTGYSGVKEGSLIDLNEDKVNADSHDNQPVTDLLDDSYIHSTLPDEHHIAEEEPDLMDLTDETVRFDPLAK